MSTLNTNDTAYTELDALLDFAYSGKARRGAERERNRAFGRFFTSILANRGTATTDRVETNSVTTCLSPCAAD